MTARVSSPPSRVSGGDSSRLSGGDSEGGSHPKKPPDHAGILRHHNEARPQPESGIIAVTQGPEGMIQGTKHPRGDDDGGWSYVSRKKPISLNKKPVTAEGRPVRENTTSSRKRQNPSHATPQPLRFASSLRSWSDICQGNRPIDQKCKLSFIAPEQRDDGRLVARVPLSAVEENVQRWRNTLVGYVLGTRPYYGHLKACVNRLWRPTCSLDVHSRENGFFVFRFGSYEESERILHGGPWLFDGRVIILKRWEEHAALDRDLLTSVPIWVRFPALHLKLWSPEVLCHLASVVGTPLYSDNATASEEKVSYARCFVEISASRPLMKIVPVVIGDSEEIDVPVEYEWVPPRCSHCSCFGHSDAQCSVALKEVWVEKKHAIIDSHLVEYPADESTDVSPVGFEHAGSPAEDVIAMEKTMAAATEPPTSTLSVEPMILTATALIPPPADIQLEHSSPPKVNESTAIAGGKQAIEDQEADNEPEFTVAIENPAWRKAMDEAAAKNYKNPKKVKPCEASLSALKRSERLRQKEGGPSTSK